LAAYGDGCATLGAGTRATMKNLSADVTQKAGEARSALKQMERDG
jgi:hypothetical protein